MKIIKSPSGKMRDLTSDEHESLIQIRRDLKIKEII
jgi:hypothetical protein